MNSYELTLVLKPEKTDAEKALTKIKGLIEAVKGKVGKTNEAGLKDLAYPIKKTGQGLYFFLSVDLAPETVAGLDRRLRIDQDVLRHLFVRV